MSGPGVVMGCDGLWSRQRSVSDIPTRFPCQQQFRARGRGWARGTFSGNTNNNNSSSGGNDFQKRTREEEWDPEYTPKSKKYYLVGERVGRRVTVVAIYLVIASV